VLDSIKPLARAIKYGSLYRYAKHRVSTAGSRHEKVSAAFLIGCGRSGTTVVGDIFRRHPDIRYFFEPYHLWAAIDPEIDVLNLYHIGAARFLLGGEHASEESRRRFDRLILDMARRRGKPSRLAMEKTPFNAVRIGYLEALADRPKYIHLVRDGVDVCRSIDRLSRDARYRIMGRPKVNHWWGLAGSKWTALARDGAAAGYYVAEVGCLQSYQAKGAYEWLVSIGEVDRWRERLGDRLLEITYERLTTEPRAALEEMCRFLGVAATPHWLERSARMIDAPRRNLGDDISLPPEMCRAFNQIQERYGFAGRAKEGYFRAATVSVAIISNEPTPYRIHVLNRLSAELPEVNIDNMFTHTISNPSMPWQMQIGSHLRPVFSPRNHLRSGRPISIHSVALYRYLRDYLTEHDVRLIILLGYNDLTRLLLLRWAAREGIPIVLTADSNVFGEGRVPRLIQFIKRRYVRWVLGRVSALMPMGTCGRAFFRLYRDHNLPEFLFPYEPDYAGLARPDESALVGFRHANGLTAGRRRLLYCGRLVEVKRVEDLIDAFVKVALSRPDWDLVIAGDGPLKDDLMARVPLWLRDRVIWLGFLQFDRTVLCYHSCHVLVHPSEFEPWGLVINEAVFCGLAVITTPVVGAAVELVRNRINGMIVPPRNVEALVEAITEVTQEGVWQEMGRQSRRMIADWRRAADPVEGMRQALRQFGLIAQSPTFSVSPDDITPQAAGPIIATTARTESHDAEIAVQTGPEIE